MEASKDKCGIESDRARPRTLGFFGGGLAATDETSEGRALRLPDPFFGGIFENCSICSYDGGVDTSLNLRSPRRIHKEKDS